MLVAVIATPVLASSATATRTLPTSVASGAEFDVTITPADCGDFGQVVETLPDGFTYLSCTPSYIGVEEVGNTVKFTFLSSESFTYRLKAPTVATTTIYTFHGIVKDENKDEYPIEDNDIKVARRSGGGGGGGGGGQSYIHGNIFGEDSNFRISRNGEVEKTIEFTSEDGRLAVIIPEGTIAKGEDGKPLDSLEVTTDENPPSPPGDAHIIGLAYNFGPGGATFDPPMAFEFTYDLDTIPEGVDEEELVVAWWDAAGGRWVELESMVDTATHTITARVAHFTTFTVIGYEEVELPPEPAAFTLSSLTISPTEVNVGEEVSISIMIANTGGELSNYEVTLKINGEVEATEEVAIAADSSQQVSFTTSKDAAGNYIVDVGGLTDSFVVKEATPATAPPAAPPAPPVVPPTPAKPVNWWLIGGISGIIGIIMAVSISLLIKRRLRA